MHEIKGRVFRDAVEQDAGAPVQERIPAHVRDADRHTGLVQHSLVKSYAFPAHQSKGRRIVLVAAVQHDLTSEADAQQRTSRCHDIAQNGVKAGLPQLAHGLSRSTHSRKNDSGRHS